MSTISKHILSNPTVDIDARRKIAEAICEASGMHESGTGPAVRQIEYRYVHGAYVMLYRELVANHRRKATSGSNDLLVIREAGALHPRESLRRRMVMLSYEWLSI